MRVALAWLLAQPVVTAVIIGAERVDQLHHKLCALHVELSADERKALDEIGAPAPDYPGWMLPFQGANRFAPAVQSRTRTVFRERYGELSGSSVRVCVVSRIRR